MENNDIEQSFMKHATLFLTVAKKKDISFSDESFDIFWKYIINNVFEGNIDKFHPALIKRYSQRCVNAWLTARKKYERYAGVWIKIKPAVNELLGSIEMYDDFKDEDEYDNPKEFANEQIDLMFSHNVDFYKLPPEDQKKIREITREKIYELLKKLNAKT